jgi:hypothetical protein
MVVRTISALCVVLLLSVPAWCQDGWERVTGIAKGTGVRIRTFDGMAYSGPLQSVDGEFVRVLDDGQESSVARKDVARVEVLTPSRRYRNMALWGGIGIAAGLLIAFATCPTCKGELPEDEARRRSVIAGVAGGGVGVGLGAVMKPYKTVYKGKRTRR